MGYLRKSFGEGRHWLSCSIGIPGCPASLKGKGLSSSLPAAHLLGSCLSNMVCELLSFFPFPTSIHQGPWFGLVLTVKSVFKVCSFLHLMDQMTRNRKTQRHRRRNSGCLNGLQGAAGQVKLRENSARWWGGSRLQQAMWHVAL